MRSPRPRWSLTPFESTRRLTWATVQRDLTALGLEGLFVLLLVLATQPGDAIVPPPPDTFVRFLAPLRQPKPRPVEERLSWIALNGSAPLSGVAAPASTGGVRPAPPPPPPGASDSSLAPPADEEPYHAFSEIEVDSAAAMDPSAGGPEYPKALIDQGIEGTVLIRFVVDSTGRVASETIQIVRSDHPGFVVAVREALPRMKYRPALLGGRPVNQLVEQPFAFRIR